MENNAVGTLPSATYSPVGATNRTFNGFSERRQKVQRCFGLVVLLALLGSAHAQGVYRWVDQAGRVHYSDAPPAAAKAKEIDCPPPPTSEEVEAARQRLQRNQQTIEQIRAQRSATEQATAGRSPPAALGRLPNNTSSKTMRTLGTGISCDWNKGPAPVYQLFLRLQVREDVPVGALLEAEFENPADAMHPLLASGVITASGFPEVKDLDVPLLPPEVDTIHCQNYKVTVRLYRDRQSRELLGTHHQLIQSRWDSALWKSLGRRNGYDYQSEHGHVCPSP